jgi:hypothetical protein
MDWKEERAKLMEQLEKLCKEGGAKKMPTITCDDCDSAKDGSCEWAWDVYNTDGDCLATK